MLLCVTLEKTRPETGSMPEYRVILDDLALSPAVFVEATCILYWALTNNPLLLQNTASNPVSKLMDEGGVTPVPAKTLNPHSFEELSFHVQTMVSVVISEASGLEGARGSVGNVEARVPGPGPEVAASWFMAVTVKVQDVNKARPVTVFTPQAEDVW